MSCNIDVYFEKILSITAVLGRMGCAKTINLVQCDTGPKLEFTLKDCSNNTILSGVSGVSLYLSRVDCGDTHCAITNVGHEGLSGINPSAGQWVYVLQDGDVSGAGTYFGDLTVTYDDGLVETAFQPVRIFVRESCRPC
jgi:hypothetical protein